MYENEWFPQVNAMGVTWNEFWHMNPRIVRLLSEGHKEKIKEQDLMNYYQGLYFANAINTTVGNMFKKKGAKAIEYPNKPFMQEAEEKQKTENMTEEERIEGVMALFARLGNMQKSFEKSKQTDGKK